MKRLKAIARKPVRLLATLVAAAALATLGLWLLRIPIAEAYTKQRLAELGVEVIALEIETLSPTQTTLRQIAFTHAYASGEILSLETNYTLRRLLNEQTLNRLDLDTAQITITPPAPSDGSNKPSPQFSPKRLHSLPQQIAQLPVPIETLSIDDLALTLETPSGPETLNLDLQRHPDSTTLHAHGQLAQTQGLYNLHLEQHSPQRLESTLTFELASASETLDTYLPEWRNLIPDTTIQKLGASKGTLDLELTDTSIFPELKLDIDALSFSYDTLNASLANVSAHLTSQNLNSLEIELQATTRSVQREDLALRSDSPLALSLKTDLQQRVNVTTTRPLDWTYSDTASGKANAQAEIILSSESDPTDLTGSIQLIAPQFSEYTFKDISATFSGTTESLALQTPPLFFTNASTPVLTAGSILVQSPENENETEPIKLSVTSTLAPNAFPSFPTDLKLTELDLHLTSEIGDIHSQHLLKLSASDSNTPLLKHTDNTVHGAFSIEFDLQENALAETYTPSLKLDASNLSIQTSELSATDLNLQAALKLPATKTSHLKAPTAPQSLETLLSELDFTIDWQANQITAGALQAQWSGGSLKSIASKSTPLAFEQSIGSGILSSNTFRFEQLYLEQTLEGDLSQLYGQSTLAALFEGIPLELNAQHSLTDPFSKYTLAGDYQLSPATFTYSDIIARLVPQASGASLSTTLSAAGSFHAQSETADASLHLEIEDTTLDYPPSQLTASGISGNIQLSSLAQLHSGELPSTLSIEAIQAGDLAAANAFLQFKFDRGNTLLLDHAALQVFDGLASLAPLGIPLDGSDFQSDLLLKQVSLEELSRYIDIFDGQLTGRINGTLPFSVIDGTFQPQSGELRLDPTQSAHLSYNAQGLLTDDDPNLPQQKASFSDKLLKFLNIQPERIVEESLGQVTIDRFDAQLFPPDDPDTPMKIQLSGTARTQEIEIPVVINLRLHGTLSELYNFLIRLNSL